QTFRAWLEAAGYTSDELVALENMLPTVFEIGFAFNAWSMPKRLLEARDVDPDAARTDPTFNGLRLLGLSSSDVAALNESICGTQMIEGAPHFEDEHLDVFDCANRCGTRGTRFIRPEGHIRMMAAAQPFISGAISKTINLPNEAAVEDISAAYRLSWELGLKANALYRDGSKLSQPLNTKSDAIVDADDDTDDDAIDAARDEVAVEVAAVAAAAGASDDGTDDASGPQYIERIVERIVERPLRRRLADTRASLTHRFNVAGHEGYLTVGLYQDGSPGELFITMSKEGSTIGGLMDSLGTAISVALQYGVPLESLVNKFAHQRFEPQGMTTNRDIPFAKSLVDYIFRWMGMEFIPGYRETNAPRRAESARTESAPSARTTMPARLSDDDDDGPNVIVPHATQKVDRIIRASVEREVRVKTTREEVVASPDALSHSTAVLMGDAPACDVCGSITVRNGTCYKCMNCGNSMGCS
ncbi:MAG: vitamin B12-dependent ribonucleotide reductase, partial [Phycisphaerales bacterium]|nr:vitamin B12-dependent ribonucleotide reductase [Phycisphaerales bacterium]